MRAESIARQNSSAGAPSPSRSQLHSASRLLCPIAAFLTAATLAVAQIAIAQTPPAPAAPEAPPAETVAPPQPAPAPPQPRFVVLLDAAHGGDDAGGHLGNTPEKDFTLALSVRLRSLLSARGIQVVTTREADVAIDPNRRAEIANHLTPQACLSLHASEAGSGVHLFTSSLTPAAPSRFPAWKTAQSAWVTRSLALAGVLNSALTHAGLTVTLGRTALPAVDSMSCPAVAVEIAPSRGSGDAITADVNDPAYQATVAEALAAALLDWKTEARQP